MNRNPSTFLNDAARTLFAICMSTLLTVGPTNGEAQTKKHDLGVVRDGDVIWIIDGDSAFKPQLISGVPCEVCLSKPVVDDCISNQESCEEARSLAKTLGETNVELTKENTSLRTEIVELKARATYFDGLKTGLIVGGGAVVLTVLIASFASAP